MESKNATFYTRRLSSNNLTIKKGGHQCSFELELTTSF
ncbi:hypothetical protein NEOC65_002335 [Neochlamydia sp. AcF65]|nr:hypothetical protein [Neochlamydia sp. AcF65]